MAQEKSSNAKRQSSPLWNRALERYRDELDENDDYNDILNEAGSMQDVLEHAKTFGILNTRERTTLNSFNRLGPILKVVDDFSAVIAVCFGVDAKLTALVWGSLRIMLTLAASAGDTLQDFLDMLEEVSLTLPEFKSYEQTVPMTKTLESSLMDLYTEIICFYARAIYFFRNHPHILVRRQAWANFQSDFSQTLKRIRRMSSTVKGEADLARMKLDTSKYKEVLDLVKEFKESKISDDADMVRCYTVPFDPNPRFWGREDATEAVSAALQKDENTSSMKTFALYGMGGVGKTQIALQYAHGHKEEYDAVIWIIADNLVSMSQSTRDVAQVVGLLKTDEEERDTMGASLKLKNWLKSYRGRWLMILDNADNLDLLSQIWPVGARGSILITSRDFNSANHPAEAGYHVQPLDTLSGSQILLGFLGLDASKASNQKDSVAIAEALGGLPLALNQIASFISQRKLPMEDFLALYERNSANIDSRKSRLTQYEHTLSTVWEMSLSRLSGPSAHLQNLMAFFEPDGVDENLLLEGSEAVAGGEFEFLSDEMDLGDAEEPLLQAALLEKKSEMRSLSVHRLIQAAVMRRLSEPDRTKYFDAVVKILRSNFDEDWNKNGAKNTNQFKSWTKEAWLRHENCLPHIMNLVKQSEKYQIVAGDAEEFGKLLIPCIWYLHEREYDEEARALLDVALKNFKDKESLAYASATNLKGIIALAMHQPGSAIEPFNCAMVIRRRLGLDEDDPLIGWGYNNLGMCFTEMSRFDEALASHEKALEIRLRTDIDRIGNSYSNMSSAYLRMGRIQEAEAYLQKCPALKDFTDETFLNANNPRFAGDMALLSRIRRAQGRLDDAMRLASKALAYRRKLLGNRFKVCDSLYDVADLLQGHGKSGSALNMLEELVLIAEGLRGGQGHLARANYKLSVLYADMGRKAESEACKQQALSLRLRLAPDTKEQAINEGSFMALCPWMIW